MTRLDTMRDDILNLPLHKACDLRINQATEGRSEIEISVNTFTSNPAGVLHGGMLYTFFDVGCLIAALTLLDEHRHPVTIDIHASVLRTATAGDRVVIRAHVDRIGRTLTSIRAEAFAIAKDDKETLIGTGAVTKSILDGRDR